MKKHLAATAVPEAADTSRSTAARTALCFIEAYFSNHIEATRFLVEEAREIVFEHVRPGQRPEDGHDVLATFRQLVELGPRDGPAWRSLREFEDELRARHADLMAARPEAGPGRFKDRRNTAGSTVFVEPRLVPGTLAAGFDLLGSIDAPFARAVFVHFLLVDVHPFADGNGRLSRIFMTKEFASAGQCRVVVPTVHRDDHVGTLRLLGREGRPDPFVRCMAFCQRVAAASAAAVEVEVEEAVRVWASTNAFLEPGDARFRMPAPWAEIVWRKGVPAPAEHWDKAS